MTYLELLQDSRWIAKRMEIIDRDNISCAKCSNINLSKYNISIAELNRRSTNIKRLIYSLESNKEISISINSFKIYGEIVKNLVLYFDDDPLHPTPIAARRIMKEESKVIQSHLTDIQWIFVLNLHVHHTYYQEGKMPWEYPNDALQTLCWSCHESLHENTKVPHLDVYGNEMGKLTPCSRCIGMGYFSEYNHIQNGVCFRCQGMKYEERINFSDT
jgi:hypothetical protein